MKNHFKILILNLLFILILAPFAWLIPLYSDEAGNYFLIARQGIKASWTQYSDPNNHVLFTIFQSFLPQSWIFADPQSLRVMNLLLIFCVGTWFCILLTKTFRIRPITAFVVWVLCALSSELTWSYLIFARGYFLGTLLLSISAILLFNQNQKLSALTSALAVFCVPTFAYSLPGFSFWLWKTKGLKTSVRWSFITIILILSFYSRIIKALMRASQEWNLKEEFFAWFVELLKYLSNTNSQLVAALILVALFLLALREKMSSFTSLVFLAVVSFFAFIGLGDLLNLVNPPFLRNAIHIPFMITLAFSLIALKQINIAKSFLILTLIVNLVFSGKEIQALFSGEKKQMANIGLMPISTFSLMPYEWDRNTWTKIYVPEDSPMEGVYRLYESRLNQKNLRRTFEKPLSVSSVCRLGDYDLGDDTRVYLFNQLDQTWYPLCLRLSM